MKKHRLNSNRQLYWHTLLSATAMSWASIALGSPVLTLKDAAELTMSFEPGVAALEKQSEALQELSSSAKQLPDPEVTLGVSNYPIEEGDLWLEPMGQLRIGLKQNVTPKQGRRAKSERNEANSLEMQYLALERKAQILKEVRSSWLDIYFAVQAEILVKESLTKLADLFEVSRSRYAIGLLNQADLLDLELEMNRLDDAIAKHQENQTFQRAVLSQWIQEAAYRPMPSELPSRTHSFEEESMETALLNHPTILAADAAIEFEEASIELAKSAFKPNLSLQAGYALRDGILPNGSSRSDLLTLSVGFQLPIFEKNRQEVNLRSANLKLSAAQLHRTKRLNALRARATSSLARYSSLQGRIQRYQLSIVPKALETEKAMVVSYQSEVGDYQHVIHSQRVALDLKLELTGLNVERLRIWAEIQYLLGDSYAG